MNAEKRPEGRSSSAGGLDDTQTTRRPLTRTEHLLDELVAGRWPGDEMPRLALEQILVAAVLRHPDDREAVAAIVPPAVVRDGDCRTIYETALLVHPNAVNQYGECVAHLRAAGVQRTEIDLLLDGGPLVFLGAGHWRRAISELVRRVAVDKVREAAVAAVASLEAGADPVQVADRLARQVVTHG